MGRKLFACDHKPFEVLPVYLTLLQAKDAATHRQVAWKSCVCGPGAIGTILGMTATIRPSSNELASFVAIVAEILATMFVTCLCLAYAGRLSQKLGTMG